MRTSLSDNDTPDGGATLITGLISPLINLKLILEITAAINPVNTGTVGFDPSLKHVLDAF